MPDAAFADFEKASSNTAGTPLAMPQHLVVNTLSKSMARYFPLRDDLEAFLKQEYPDQAGMKVQASG